MNHQPCSRNSLRLNGIFTVTVLAIVESQGRRVNPALHQVRADMLLCGVTVNIFDSLRGLPLYRDDRQVGVPECGVSSGVSVLL